jgi:hypothetical protein
MAFAGPDEPLPVGSWSRGLNFLAWQADSEGTTPDLPAGSRVRVTFRWREPHDPSLQRTGEDAFRDPLLVVRLLVLRQPDPAGERRPADDLEVVAQSSGLPLRLEHTPSSGAYEVSVDVPVREAGRYALRVEGRVPESDRPANLPTLPTLRRTGEIRPRITVDTLDGSGRAVWRDYRGDDGGAAEPARAR